MCFCHLKFSSLLCNREFTEVMRNLIGQYWEFAISNMEWIDTYPKMKLGNLQFIVAKMYLNRNDQIYFRYHIKDVNR